jgi:hypothetical protein
MREKHWYHEQCIPKSGKTASAGPKQGLCAGCGIEGLVSEYQVGTWVREPVVDARTINVTMPEEAEVVVEAISEEVAESIVAESVDSAVDALEGAIPDEVVTEAIKETTTDALPDTAIEPEPDALTPEEEEAAAKAKAIEELEEQLKALCATHAGADEEVQGTNSDSHKTGNREHDNSPKDDNALCGPKVHREATGQLQGETPTVWHRGHVLMVCGRSYITVRLCEGRRYGQAKGTYSDAKTRQSNGISSTLADWSWWSQEVLKTRHTGRCSRQEIQCVHGRLCTTRTDRTVRATVHYTLTRRITRNDGIIPVESDNGG